MTFATVELPELSSITILITQVLLASSFLLALARLVKGPDVTDRVVALDLIAGVILAFTLFHSIIQKDVNFMNVSLAIAVIAFLGTVAVARYLELRVKETRAEESEEEADEASSSKSKNATASAN